MASPWMSVTRAARTLGISPEALRARINRQSKKLGLTEFVIDGMRVKRLGSTWRVQLDPSWTA